MILLTIFSLIVLLFSVIIHEIAHGFVALLLGDTTAKREGRLTLNPIKHLDPIGSVVVPLLLLLMNSGIVFGWAKPVPINPYNFKDQKYGQAKVALAGPAVNFLIAIIFGIIIRFIPEQANLFYQNLLTTFGFIIWINLLLGVFNLVPIPPLDGSHILFTFLPNSSQRIKIFFNRYGLFFLLVFIFYLFPLIVPIISFLFRLITGISFI